jgi:hypothetical protein
VGACLDSQVGHESLGEVSGELLRDLSDHDFCRKINDKRRGVGVRTSRVERQLPRG